MRGSSMTVPSTSPVTIQLSGSTEARSADKAIPRLRPSPRPPCLRAAPDARNRGELKNTFCLASGRDAWMSQHIGDMGSLETLAAFERVDTPVR